MSIPAILNPILNPILSIPKIRLSYKTTIKLLGTCPKMTNFDSNQYEEIEQPEVSVLCRFSFSINDKEKTSWQNASKSTGVFLLGFVHFPGVGNVFSYEGNLWKVKAVFQFPNRYNPTAEEVEEVHPIADLEWVSSCESAEDSIRQYRDLKPKK